MTDPTGKVFISYRRNRLAETDELIQTLHDRGLPTWRDVDSLTSEPTEAAIRGALNDERTSGAVLWLTPDVIDSPIIKDVEVPLAVRRQRRNDGFWLVIVLAGGLSYGDVDAMFAGSLGGEELSSWNLTKISEKWATPADILAIANTALLRRVGAVTAQHPLAPRVVSVHAKGTFSPAPDDELALDWTRFFKSGSPTDDAWTGMQTAATDVSGLIKRHAAPGEPIHYYGTASMATALMLGSTYSTRDGRAPAWIQRQPDGTAFTPWLLSDSPDAALARDTGWAATPTFKVAGATDLAVCVNINDDVTEAFARSADISPPWRAMLLIASTRQRDMWMEPVTAAEAASLVRLIIDEVRTFRREVGGLTGIHLFMAAPAGIAFLLGTVLATLPPITTYEFDTVAGRYVRAVRLQS